MDTKDDPMDERAKDASDRAYEEFEKFRRTINNNWNSGTSVKTCGASPVERKSETGKPSTETARRGETIDGKDK